MNFTTILINATALLLILFVLWWFFGSKIKTIRYDTSVPIIIEVKDGSYQPAFIQVATDKRIPLQFIRRDPTPCAEYVIFKQLNTSYRLPLNQKVEILLPALGESEIDFSCQMGMYRGKIIAVK